MLRHCYFQFKFKYELKVEMENISDKQNPLENILESLEQ